MSTAQRHFKGGSVQVEVKKMSPQKEREKLKNRTECEMLNTPSRGEK